MASVEIALVCGLKVRVGCQDSVGIRLTPSFVIIFFFGNSFFSMTQRKSISLSLSAANVAG